MTDVPFVDLRAQSKSLRPEYEAAIWPVIDRAAYVLGDELREFERSFALFSGCTHALGVASGTDALLLAYRAAGIARGDEVIVPVNTFIATAEPLTHIGARPVFVDCLAATANIDPALAAAAVTERTKAIVPVHLYGQPVALDEIVNIAQAHQLLVIEDAAQAHGARFADQPIGSFGKVSAFSFYPGKNLGALGDGGAVVTSDPDIAEHVRLLRNHGDKSKSDHVEVGYCSRLDNLQAALLIVKLRHLEEWNAGRRKAAQHYARLLSEVEGVTMFETPRDSLPVYHLFVVQVENRDKVRQQLGDAGIQTGIHYPRPLHLTPAYAPLGYARGDFPVAERLAERILSLPMFPEITSAQIEYVVEHLAKAVAA